MATKIEGATRSNLYLIDPELLTLVMEPGHPLYDPRVLEPVDEALVLNMMMKGNTTPIIVNKNGQDFDVVDGRHRVKAAREANKRLLAEGKVPIKVKALVSQASEEDLFSLMIITNEFRKDDNVLAKADKAKKLQDMGKSINEVAIIFGVTPKSVHSWNQLNDLSTKVRNAVATGKIAATAATELRDLAKNDQDAKLEELMADGVKVSKAKITKERKGEKSQLDRPRTKKEMEKRLDLNVDTPWGEAKWLHDNEIDGHMDPYETFQLGYTAALEWALKLDGATDDIPSTNAKQPKHVQTLPPTVPGKAREENDTVHPERSGGKGGSLSQLAGTIPA